MRDDKKINLTKMIKEEIKDGGWFYYGSINARKCRPKKFNTGYLQVGHDKENGCFIDVFDKRTYFLDDTDIRKKYKIVPFEMIFNEGKLYGDLIVTLIIINEQIEIDDLNIRSFRGEMLVGNSIYINGINIELIMESNYEDNC